MGGLHRCLFGLLGSSRVEVAGLGILGVTGEMATIACSGLGSDAPLVGAVELVLSGVIADPGRSDGRSVSERARAGAKGG